MKKLIRRCAVAGVGVATTIGLVGASPAYAASTIVVHPGQSIQAAVDRAHSGDTILIKPGHYHEGVLVSKSGLQIRGSGGSEGGTVLEPWTGKPRNPCEQAKSGICIVDLAGHTRVTNTRVSGLWTRGYGDSGVIAFHARNLSVDNVRATNNGGYGIARFDTINSALIDNIAMNNGEAGLYIGDSPEANTFVAGNTVVGNGYGIFIRHAMTRRGSVQQHS